MLLAWGCAKPTPPPEPAVAEARQWPLDLEQPLPTEAADLLAQYKVILVGEIHGTKQTPHLVYRIVEALSQRGYEVRLGLEMWRSEQGAIDAFMKSGDKRALERSSFFTKEDQYGVATTATAQLLGDVRTLRGVEAVCVDDEEAQTGSDRDRAMAEAASGWEREKRVTVLLAGNLHTRLERGSPWNPDYAPAGYLMQEWYGIPPDKILALRVTFDRGTYWACFAGEEGRPDCGVKTREPDADVVDSFLSVGGPLRNGHNGQVHFREVEAAFPFAHQAEPEPTAPTDEPKSAEVETDDD